MTTSYPYSYAEIWRFHLYRFAYPNAAPGDIVAAACNVGQSSSSKVDPPASTAFTDERPRHGKKKRRDDGRGRGRDGGIGYEEGLGGGREPGEMTGDEGVARKNLINSDTGMDMDMAAPPGERVRSSNRLQSGAQARLANRTSAESPSVGRVGTFITPGNTSGGVEEQAHGSSAESRNDQGDGRIKRNKKRRSKIRVSGGDASTLHGREYASGPGLMGRSEATAGPSSGLRIISSPEGGSAVLDGRGDVLVNSEKVKKSKKHRNDRRVEQGRSEEKGGSMEMEVANTKTKSMGMNKKERKNKNKEQKKEKDKSTVNTNRAAATRTTMPTSAPTTYPLFPNPALTPIHPHTSLPQYINPAILQRFIPDPSQARIPDHQGTYGIEYDELATPFQPIRYQRVIYPVQQNMQRSDAGTSVGAGGTGNVFGNGATRSGTGGDRGERRKRPTWAALQST